MTPEHYSLHHAFSPKRKYKARQAHRANKQETSTNTEIKFSLISEIELTDENKKAIFKFSHNSNVY